MTIIFQILAVVAIIVAAIFMLRGGGARHQALRRVFMLIFIIAAASSVFFPQAWTWIANLIGIGRGADLLLYLLVLTFLGFVATTYRRFRHLENNVTELSRRMALLTVEAPAGHKPEEQDSKLTTEASCAKSSDSKKDSNR